jgi:hypothetical protein
VTLSAGENDTSWDAGLYRKASVATRSGKTGTTTTSRTVGEGGIGNIKVQLLNATGTSVLATTYTDSSGNYKFSNLNPGTYVLQFDKTNVSFSNSHWGGTYNMSTGSGQSRTPAATTRSIPTWPAMRSPPPTSARPTPSRWFRARTT